MLHGGMGNFTPVCIAACVHMPTQGWMLYSHPSGGTSVVCMKHKQHEVMAVSPAGAQGRRLLLGVYAVPHGGRAAMTILCVDLVAADGQLDAAHIYPLPLQDAFGRRLLSWGSCCYLGRNGRNGWGSRGW